MRKRACLALLCLLLIICGSSCGEAHGYKIAPPPSDFDSGVEFVQACKNYDQMDVITYVVEDIEELRQLYSILPNEYTLYSYDVSGNTDFSTYTYDEEFFRTHAMILARTFCFTGSSSIRYSATCSRQGDTFIIDLEDNAVPDLPYTCDVGWHTLLIPVDRAELDGVTEIKYQ